MVFKFFKVYNSSNGSLDQTWRVYKSKTLICISRIFSIHSLDNKLLSIDFWISLNFFFFFFCQNPSKFFWFFQTLKTKLCYSSLSFRSPFAKKNSPRTNHLNSFCVSLLPFPKERRTNCLNSFVSPFSLVKEFKTTQSEDSFDFSLSHKQ